MRRHRYAMVRGACKTLGHLGKSCIEVGASRLSGPMLQIGCSAHQRIELYDDRAPSIAPTRNQTGEAC